MKLKIAKELNKLFGKTSSDLEHPGLVSINGKQVQTLYDQYQQLLKNVKSIEQQNPDAHQMLMSDVTKAFKEYQIEFKAKTLLYEFEISYKENTWCIRKTYQQFEKFDYRFKRNGFNIERKRCKHITFPKNQASCTPKIEDGQNMLDELSDYINRIIFEFSQDEKFCQQIQEFLDINFKLDDIKFKIVKCDMIDRKRGQKSRKGRKFSCRKNILFEGGLKKIQNCCLKFTRKRLKTYYKNAMGKPQWRKKMFLLGNEGICYIDKKEILAFQDKSGSTQQIKDFFVFTKDVKIRLNEHRTDSSHFGISISTKSNTLRVRCKSFKNYIDWVYCFSQSQLNSDYTKPNEYHSFAPKRLKNFTKGYINAHEYFIDIFDAIENAQECIFITDWWFSPELYLKRPVEDYPESRLDYTLQRAANRGVKIYIVLYKESKVCYNASLHAKNMLTKFLDKLKPDHKDNVHIEVLRHPTDLIFIWSHHEKMCVIDQSIGFMGGIDLCFGRYEYPGYRQTEPFEGKTMWPGQDYNNFQVQDFENLEKTAHTCLIDKNSVPRIPWRDIAIQLKGPVVHDLVIHFIEYWNYAKYCIEGHSRDNILAFGESGSSRNIAPTDMPDTAHQTLYQPRPIMDDDTATGQNRPTGTVQVSQSGYHQMNEGNLDSESSSQDIGKQFTSESGLTQIDDRMVSPSPDFGLTQQAAGDFEMKILGVKDDEDNINETKKKSSYGELNKNPLGMMLQGVGQLIGQVINKPSRNSFDTALYRWQDAITKVMIQNREKKGISANEQKYADLLRKARRKPKLNFMLKKEEPLTPQNRPIGQPAPLSKSKTSFVQKTSDYQIEKKDSTAKGPFKAIDSQRKSITKIANNRFQMQNFRNEEFENKDDYTKSCQILRSSGTWSTGLDESAVENSIQQGYIRNIQKAKHFIYIENQFFMSANGNRSVIENMIVDTIIQKMIEKILAGEDFVQLLAIPLQPGQGGDLNGKSGNLLRIQLFYELQTICRGPESLWGKISQYTDTPEKYMKVIGFRTCDVMNDLSVQTSMIYVHSKFMIVDDELVLLGSANINDRSQLGVRDSELAVVVEDTEMVDGIRAGKAVKLPKFSYEWRKKVFIENFHMNDDEVKDVMDPEMWRKIDEITLRNTEVYREVFACFPDDEIKNCTEVNDYHKKSDVSKYDKLRKDIKGIAVRWPMKFLENEKLEDIQSFQFELMLIPSYAWA